MKISKKKHIRKITQVKNTKIAKSHEMELLQSIEQRISMNVDSFLVLSEEGDPTQIALAFQNAKNEFMKLGPEMHRIAIIIGGDLPIFVDDFLESIDIILHGQGMLDEDLISHCLDTSARLKAELKGLSPNRPL
jgi:hypothetical protein